MTVRAFPFLALAGRLMHFLPAGLWSVIAPIQLSPTFRSEHRTAHRRMGRLFIAMSVSIAIGVVPLVMSGATKLDETKVRSPLGSKGGRARTQYHARP